MGTSFASIQSVIHTSWSASSVFTVSRQSVAKWPDSGANTITFGCFGAPSLRKCSSRQKGFWTS
jgi:hypothetical protein